MSATHILPRLTINTDLARKILVLFLRDAVTKVGFQRAVLGLSGGIDSALAAYLVAEALGPENVLAIRMPYKTSSPDSLSDAQAVIDALGVRSDTVEITPMVDPLLERFPDVTNLRKGNIMARMRMVVLYDQSAAFDALVIGTSIGIAYATAPVEADALVQAADAALYAAKHAGRGCFRVAGDAPGAASAAL